MRTDTTTQKGKPTGSANYPAGHTDSASLPAAVSTIKAGAGLRAHADDTWLDELQALADRFGCGVSADMATMSRAQLWALYGFLKAKARGA